MNNSLRNIEAIVFDMDGLMFDTETVCRRAHNEAGSILGIPNADDLYFKSLAMTYENANMLYSQILKNKQLANEFIQLIAEISMNIYMNEPLRIKPGLYELVEYLKKKDYKKAIASSAPIHEISDHLIKSGLSDSFRTIVSGQDLVHGKPAPDIYLLAASTLGINPKNILVLEDSYFGIESAYAAGAIPVMIPDIVKPDNTIREKTYAILDSLDQVIGLLDNKKNDKET